MTPDAIRTAQMKMEQDIKSSFVQTTDSKRAMRGKTITHAAKGFKRAGKSGKKL